jgi:ABC-2 type transport system ATP-binding protein
MPIIEMNALTRKFKDLVAVDNLTISVEKGEVFGLLGPNGAGKTTVVKMLTTLLKPTSGEASVAGFSITHRSSDVRRVIGYVPQMLSADGTLTGYENLMIFAKLQDIPRAERKQRVQTALSSIGLEDVGGKLVRTYSGGMIRRLEIVQTMMHEFIWEHIGKLRAEQGTTILLTTHMMEEADSLCSRVAIMHRGKLVALGSPAELKAAIGKENATLEDVFIHFTGDKLESGGSYIDTKRTRRTARRVG